MRIKNLTPFLAGTMPAPLQPGQPLMTVIVKGTFRLRPGAPVAPLEGLGEQGTLSGDRFEASDDDRQGALLYASDFADTKLRADLLLRGHCHTPGGRPMRECPVRFSIGSWSKLLRVVGPRVWVEKLSGAAPSEPEPFTSMPIDFAHAFGGPSHPENPAGRGLDTPDLPTIELPGEPLFGKRDRPTPAGLGPLSPFWPQRRSKLGKEYGKSYQESRAPGYAADFDASYFNAAPPDQQVDLLRGDEEMSFVNLHPAAATFSARLPDLRIRAFVHDDERRFREVKMRLDTLLADLDREVLVLTWRGLTPVREDDLADVTTVLVASEPRPQDPAAASGYEATLLAFEADPTGFASHPLRQRSGEAAPPPGGKERAPAAPGRHTAQPVDRTRPPDDKAGPAPDDLRPAFAGKLSRLPRQERDRVRLSIDRLTNIAPPGVDLKQRVAEAVKGPAGPGPRGRPPILLPRKPGAEPYVPLGHEIARVRAAAERAAGALGGESSRPHTGAAAEDLVREIRAVEQDPAVRRLDPYLDRRGSPGDKPGPGADLSGQDLSGQDLSGLDMTGANLEGAILHGARLAGAHLAGARMKHAILYEADLTGADLTGADLTQANVSRARARGAVLRDARLDQAAFEAADLREVDLGGATGEYTLLSRADLTSARARGARFDHLECQAAVLTEADLSGAKLTACRLSACSAQGVILAGAVLDGTSFAESDLTRAVLTEARGDGAVFRHARLDAADMSRAIFPASHFDGAAGSGVKLRAAVLRGARLYRASLPGADLSRADLFEADLRKADLTGASLRRAMLFGAKLRQTATGGCDLRDAVLDRAVGRSN